MVFARYEMEYLGSIDCSEHVDLELIDEMWHRLDALRCHDQEIDASDWRPTSAEARRPPLRGRGRR
jgi:hypothetical protein